MTAEILPAAEATALAEHEAVIERGIRTFYEVGQALADIRDRRLYRAAYGTFEEYAEQRWQMSRRRAYQMIEAAGVVNNFSHSEVTPPATESQARELARVPEPERAEVWAATVERTEGKPTAAAVRETYEQRQQSDADLIAGDDWTPAPEPKQKRRPLPEAFTDATRDLGRATERLERLAADDRFNRNQDATRRQVPDLLGALERTTALVTALDLPGAEASEEARRWWATSLHKIADALHGVAQSIEQEH
jgi:hypothetical protein